jgi:hypothetical protein
MQHVGYGGRQGRRHWLPITACRAGGRPSQQNSSTIRRTWARHSWSGPWRTLPAALKDSKQSPWRPAAVQAHAQEAFGCPMAANAGQTAAWRALYTTHSSPAMIMMGTAAGGACSLWLHAAPPPRNPRGRFGRVRVRGRDGRHGHARCKACCLTHHAVHKPSGRLLAGPAAAGAVVEDTSAAAVAQVAGQAQRGSVRDTRVSQLSNTHHVAQQQPTRHTAPTHCAPAPP